MSFKQQVDLNQLQIYFSQLGLDLSHLTNTHNYTELIYWITLLSEAMNAIS